MTEDSQIALAPDVLVGKPVVRGTRLSVEFVIGLMADGWSEADILQNYPGLTHEDVIACRVRPRRADRGESFSERSLTYALPRQRNFPGAAIAALEAAGHDVVWVRIRAPGASDPDVLAWAAYEERILLTFDKDFGELAKKSNLPPTCGVVLLRMPTPSVRDVGRKLAALIMARDDWAGSFSVIEPGRVRMRALKE